MATTTTSSVYINVIQDVINKVRGDFLQSGVEESVLTDLQGLWEMRMMECGAICGPIERTAQMKPVPSAVGSATGNGVVPPVHDLNVPYEATEEYETPTAEMLFPPTPLQTPTPMHTPLPGNTPLPGTVDQHSFYHLPTPSDYSDIGSMHDMKPGRPSPYMQPPSPWMHQRPLGVDVNVAYVEGRDDELDRGTSNQPMTQDFFTMSSGKRKREEFVPHFHGGGYIPQQDGAGDTSFDLFQNESYPYQTVTSEDYNAVNTPAAPDLQVDTPHVGTQNEGGDDDDDEPPLNENDDDAADDLDDEDEPNTQHLVLAQFDKVTRAKNKWKFTLKDGIMHINNKDIVFNKANGEMEF